MKKATKITLTVIFSLIALCLASVMILLSLAGAFGLGITGFVSWVWGGVRFSPEAAMEALSLSSSDGERIEGEDCYFYYRTFGEVYGVTGEMSDAICYFTPVLKNSVGMWYAVADLPEKYSSRVYEKESGEEVGVLTFVEVEGRYHNFFVPNYTRDTLGEDIIFPEIFSDAYTRITVDGKEKELFGHSYFMSGAKIDSFEINGYLLETKN